MGSVWAAEHLALDTLVAVKFMTRDHVLQPDLAARFRREAQAAAQLRSPHVTQVLDYGVTPDGEPYIVMELLEGETLRQRLRRVGNLPLGEVVHLIEQMAKGLSRAHQLGLVHRDIKPDNLFLIDVEGDPFVKVLDFGIAKHTALDVTTKTSTGAMLGTPFYMSPEQFDGAKDIDHRADLWALGIVTYQMLTGRLPFTGNTIVALARSAQAGNFAPPMQRGMHVDSAVRPGCGHHLRGELEVLERVIGDRADVEQVRALPARHDRAVLDLPRLGRSDGCQPVSVLPSSSDCQLDCPSGLGACREPIAKSSNTMTASARTMNLLSGEPPVSADWRRASRRRARPSSRYLASA